ncbi:MAG: phage integrase SAM-like domain-containing protein, partial [Duncaniella sp.]|nr:phage integrase SAM-like domain-containing protein [Duncaniella sp.]
MASIKVKFRPSVIADHEGTIYYQIIHERKQRQLLTDYHVFPNEWNNKGAKVLTVSDDYRRLSVQSIGQSIRWDVERLSRIVKRLDKGDLPYSAEDVVEEFRHYISNYSLFKFMDRIIAKLKKNGKLRTAETYRSALNSFRKFLINEYSGTNHYLMHDIMIDCIDSEIMEAYEAWNVRRGITPNTISFYNRILRAVYNRAVEDNIIDSKFPFKHLYTGVDKTVKRALPLS